MTTLASPQEEDLEALLQLEDFPELKTLSRGIIPLLKKCDNLFPDTSVLLNGVASYDEEYFKSLDDFKNSRNRYDIFSLLNIYDACANPDDERVSKEDISWIHKTIDRSIETSDTTLDILTMLSNGNRLIFPQETQREFRKAYTLLMESWDLFSISFDSVMRKGYTRYLFEKDEKLALNLKEERRDIFEQQQEYVHNLVTFSKENMDMFLALLENAEKAGEIAPSSNLFSDSDSKIIDSAIAFPGSSLILSCDHHFREKAKRVVKIRNEKGLKIPSTYLIFSHHDLRGYRTDSFHPNY